MSKIVFQLGNNSELSRAEINSVFSIKEGSWIGGKNFYELQIPKQILRKRFNELGGSMRAFEKKFEGGSYEEVFEALLQDIKKNAVSGKKMKVGIFFFSYLLEKKIIDLTKRIKLYAKENNISLRIVNRGVKNLDSMAVLKEKLLQKGNGEYGIIQQKKRWYLLKTLEIQDIRGFVKRDIEKPIRDMKVGMMPPKMARMMINISRDKGILPSKIYDPFCGTGTVLLEALDLNIKISGSDISMKMVEATKKNTLWYFNEIYLQNKMQETEQEEFSNMIHLSKRPFFINDIFKKDATKLFSEKDVKRVKGAVVVGEGFLGRPLHKPITENQFWEYKDELFPLYRKFLFSLSQIQTKKIVFGFPFWRGKTKRYSFSKKLQEFMEKMHYSSKHITSYIRKGQIVGREIICFEKNKK